MRSAVLLLGAMTVALAVPAAAQNNTGGSGWTVSRNTVSGDLDWSEGSTTYTALVGTGNPSVWEANTPSTKWISAWSNFSTGAGGASYNRTNDANARWRYLFTYDFGGPLGAGDLYFDMGWDNILKSLSFNNGALANDVSFYNLSSNPRSVDDYFGFCRTSDAIWNSGNGTCTAHFKVPVIAGATSMTFELWGDGITDGMWLQWDSANTTTEVVPEPATMTLLATGLVGMAAARRRRNAPKA